jgi:hypothetical protein
MKMATRTQRFDLEAARRGDGEVSVFEEAPARGPNAGADNYRRIFLAFQVKRRISLPRRAECLMKYGDNWINSPSGACSETPKCQNPESRLLLD